MTAASFSAAQVDLIKRFFVGVYALEHGHHRGNTKITEFVLNNAIDDEIPEDVLNSFSEEQMERHFSIFNRLTEYKYSKRFLKSLGFSPLSLGLSAAECSFALEEIIGSNRWEGREE